MQIFVHDYLLLSAGADPNHCIGDANPLIESAANGDIEIIQLLVSSGAEVDTWLNNTGSALSIAADNYRADAYKLLFNLTSEEVARKSNLAALQNPKDIRTIDLVESMGFDLNTFDEEYSINPLMSNVDDKNEGAVKKLIDYGVNVDAQNNAGETALMIAAKRGNFNMVKILLDACSNKEIKDLDGFTALDKALANSRQKWLTKISDFDGVMKILS
jgi:uncharacterized protein